MNSSKVHCEVYLEGVLVPFNAISIQEAVGTIPSATISFPVSAAITSMLPKTICQVFYSEFNPTAKEAKDLYKMVQIFEGEYSRFSFSGNMDKRSIQAQFRGFTQNFENAHIVPVDVALPSKLVEKATQLILTEDGTKTVKHDLLHPENVLTQLAGLEKSLLPSVIIKAIVEQYAKDSYFTSIFKLFKMDKQMFYADPKPAAGKTSALLGTLSNMSKSNLINKVGLTLTSTSRLIDFVNQLLAEIGFEMQELAAPSYVKSSIRRVLVKPDTSFFEPIKCNTVFDGDIANLQFNRDFDNEPTRQIRSTPMLGISATTEQEKLIMSVIVPAGIVLAKSADPKDTGTINALGFTAEERLRGVLINEIGASTIAPDYIMAAANDAGIISKTEVQSMQKFFEAVGKNFDSTFNMSTELIKKAMTSDQKYAIQKMYLSLSTMAWLHNRQENRSCSATSPYNPYRMVGFTGAIITKELPTIVGMLHSVSSTITADGSAIQSLSFSHCMLHNPDIAVTSVDNLINEDLVSLAPPWYSDYTGDGIDAFYTDVTGLPNKALRFGVNIKDGKTVTPIPSTVRTAIDTLKKDIENTPKEDTYKSFVYEHTRRVLVPKDIAMKLYDDKLRSLATEKAGNAQRIPTTGSPYIEERRKRVLDIFVPKDLVHKDVYEKFGYQINN